MKKIVFTSVIAYFIINFQLFAQDYNRNRLTPEERIQKQVEAINKACSLTKEQQISIEQIITDSNKKLIDLRNTKPTQRGDKLNKFQEIRDNQDAEIKKILSPEQYKKYQDLNEKQKEKLRERRMGNRGEILETEQQ